ncbi:MAG: NAD(P)/FAD-dependent oxidoreductase [Myxococcales bacterium]|nr:NAD(P)/FAD-dependent oxidoreductase [Myxococcales bacterium]
MPEPKQVVIVGAGFAGLGAARRLGGVRDLRVTVVDRRNYHLFQPLLYQVAMAGLSPADIARPIRALVSGHRNVRVIHGAVESVDVKARRVSGDFGSLDYDYLLLATGAQHAYFGNEHWEPFAPGLKTLEQATEIRRRLLSAFERAEREQNIEERKRQLSFVIVGGGATGVELAGAIGELSRFTLAQDFRTIDPKLTRVILIEGGERILPGFDEAMASRATRDLESLGVQVWTRSLVTDVDPWGVQVGDERVAAATVLWAAGVRASELGSQLGVDVDRSGRVPVQEDLSIEGHPELFVLGDLALARDRSGEALPGVAPVALQQGRYVGALIAAELAGRPRSPFHYVDKGQMATIGRSRAVVKAPGLRLSGWLAWMAWLLIHIYYLSGFRNRLLVLIQWAWSYITFGRGARLIVEKGWRSYPDASPEDEGQQEPARRVG